jgi:hypothetical protein
LGEWGTGRWASFLKPAKRRRRRSTNMGLGEHGTMAPTVPKVQKVLPTSNACSILCVDSITLNAFAEGGGLYACPSGRSASMRPVCITAISNHGSQQPGQGDLSATWTRTHRRIIQSKPQCNRSISNFKKNDSTGACVCKRGRDTHTNAVKEQESIVRNGEATVLQV